MKKIIPLVALVLIFAACKKENSNIKSLPATDNSSTEAVSTDIDGVTGKNSIRIGTQVWKTANLNVSRYRNGDKIPQVSDPTAWSGLTTGAWCYYNNDTANRAIYGKLYNWYAVNDPRGLAPTGWHIPSNAEWATLSAFLGGDAVSGGQLKSIGVFEAGTGLWYQPNVNATNSSGFTGLPGGYRYPSGSFQYIHSYGLWWTSTEYFANDAWYSYLYYWSGEKFSYTNSKQDGLSVRCVKD